MKNNFINEITTRGFFHQCTDEVKLTNLLNNKSIKECLEKGTEMSSKVIQIIGARLS